MEIVSGAAKHRKRLQGVLALTSAYLLAEVIGGVLTGSLALLADAGHMLTDVLGLALALSAIRFAAKPATPERTYGYHRAEILAAMANGIILLLISGFILYEAWRRFREPEPIQSGPMLAVAVVGLVVNILSAVLLRGASGESLNLRGAYFEVVSDLLGSVGVIVAAAILYFTGWYYADPLISVGIGLFIIPRTWKLLRETVGVLLEGTPADVDLAALEQDISGVPGVRRVHDLHVWSLTSGVNAMSGHVVLARGADGEAVRRQVDELLGSRYKIGHTTIQTEATDQESSEPAF
jgi:cobalt-zinc-cadmium efflux system protein